MMRCLYAGVSGLQNHQTRMDVVGNNVANVNTYGFKKGRVNFQDLIYQQSQGAAKPNQEVGGVNPKEVGLGMSVASIDTIHTQGALQSTGNQTDLAINGNGFFILKDGEKSFYTRNGDFSLDRNGTYVNPANGMKVQGWMAQYVNGQAFIDTSRQTSDLVIPIGSKDPAKQTDNIDFRCNLNKLTPEIPEGNTDPDTIRKGTWTTNIDIYDNMGQKHNLQVQFTRVPGTPNRWRAEAIVNPENQVPPTNTTLGLNAPAGAGTADGNVFFVQFDNNGKLLQVVDGQGNASGEQGKLSLQVGFDVPNSRGADGNPVRQTMRVNMGDVGSTTDTVTQYAQDSSTKVFQQDGYGMGYLESFKIDQSGIITGVYSNGNRREIGQVALATFTNNGGLEKAGENTFVQSNNSGIPDVGPVGVAGKGKIIGGTLEMSNVDLAEQFTDMIVTQRGFQANSKTIQTADQMLQELLTLKR
jgi:flagellar hook protein FlgE